MVSRRVPTSLRIIWLSREMVPLHVNSLSQIAGGPGESSRTIRHVLSVSTEAALVAADLAHGQGHIFDKIK